MTEMKRSYLIQRLDPPYKNRDREPDAAGNPFAFGGGLARSGLTKEASQVLGAAFQFDYMGAAEYEFGAVPEALHQIANRAHAQELTAFSFTVSLADISTGWSKNEKKVTGDGTVYVLCRQDDAEEIERRITWWALNEEKQGRPTDEYRENAVRDTTYVGSALRDLAIPAEEDDYRRRTAGWLELNNGFFFFTDEDMWRETSAIFGVDVDELAA